MRIILPLLVAFVVVFVLPMLARVWRLYRASRRPAAELMPLLAEQAVANAATHNIHFDYTTDSIQQVETLLAAMHDAYVTDPSAVSVNLSAMRYGAYIGEAIRRSDPLCQNDPTCGWQTDHHVAGPKSYPFSWRGGESFPTAWCYKRIVNGDEDNVWVKYTLLRDRTIEGRLSST